MHGAFFANRVQLNLPMVFAIAGALNLSKPALRQALEAGTYVGKVREDFIGKEAVRNLPQFRYAP